jgi:IPT/TIG domain
VVELMIILILAVVVVAVALYHRFFGSDARSIAGHRTRMERLSQMDRTVGSRQDRDVDVAAGVRVLESVAPRPVLSPSNTARISTAADPERDAYRDTVTSDYGGWGPPVSSAGRPGPGQPTAMGGSPSPVAEAGADGSLAVDSPARFFDDYELVSHSDETARTAVVGAADAGYPDQPVSSRRRLVWWRHPLWRAVGLGAIAVVVVVVGVLVFATGGRHPQPVTNAQSGPGGHSASSSRLPAPSSATHGRLTSPPAPTAPPTTHPASVTPRPAVTTPSASTAVPPGPGPTLTALSPTSGAAGQQVTLTGRNLFSGNGQIIVRFGTVQAAVACPDRTTCHASVPRQSFNGPAKPTKVQVTLTTDTGTSKPAVFTYR